MTKEYRKLSSMPSLAPRIDRRRFLALLGLFWVAPLVWAQGTGMTPIPSRPPAPVLQLKDSDDQLIDLAQYRGRVVLVNFWATWCPPCRQEFPSLGRVRERFPPGTFEVIAVNVGEEVETAFPFTGSTPFPVVFDNEAKTLAAWSVRGLPTTFLVDRQGHLAFQATGGREFDAADIVVIIEQLLNH